MTAFDPTEKPWVVVTDDGLRILARCATERAAYWWCRTNGALVPYDGARIGPADADAFKDAK